jgi:hypothetical protein
VANQFNSNSNSNSYNNNNNNNNNHHHQQPNNPITVSDEKCLLFPTLA